MADRAGDAASTPKRAKFKPQAGRRKVHFVCYLEPAQIEKLTRLHERTRVPKAVFIREALDMLFERWADELEEL